MVDALQATEQQRGKPSLGHTQVPLKGRATIIGDIHGDYKAMCKIFNQNGSPSRENPYIALG